MLILEHGISEDHLRCLALPLPSSLFASVFFMMAAPLYRGWETEGEKDALETWKRLDSFT